MSPPRFVETCPSESESKEEEQQQQGIVIYWLVIKVVMLNLHFRSIGNEQVINLGYEIDAGEDINKQRTVSVGVKEDWRTEEGRPAEPEA